LSDGCEEGLAYKYTTPLITRLAVNREFHSSGKALIKKNSTPLMERKETLTIKIYGNW
jgi:hypothetical protein